MSNTEYDFTWEEIAFSSKRKALNDLKAVFIAAPRELSAARFTQLAKEYLQQGNIILGLSKEPHVIGFEDQPQFRMLRRKIVDAVIKKVNTSPSPHKIYTLSYSQRDTKHIFDKLKIKQVVLVNGSWKYAFHTQEPYYVLVKRGIPYKMISPFTDEREAQAYVVPTEKEALRKVFSWINKNTQLYPTADTMLRIADSTANISFDSSFQTGVALGRAIPNVVDQYELLIYTFNKVVPYQTYALHYGNSREKFFSPPNDLNHYDTVHAEVEMLIGVQKKKIDLKGTTLFINLMPCPTCSRMLGETDIEEFVYVHDHSDGYAIQMLEAAGKKVRRRVPPHNMLEG
jgi:deoxycytidylate deaminase